MSQLDRSFEQLRGRACWGVQRAFGSFLTLEFGRPRLVIREPRAPPAGASRLMQRICERRLIVVKGRWQLWIYCCDGHQDPGRDRWRPLAR